MEEIMINLITCSGKIGCKTHRNETCTQQQKKFITDIFKNKNTILMESYIS